MIGSSLAGYLYLALYLLLHITPSYLWWFWSVGFDGTHIFATASRTFFDREARRRNRTLFFGSLAFFFSLGPALVLAGLMHVLIGIVAVWAYYHVVRQHYGFMVLYKVKNRDLRPVDNLLDRFFLGVDDDLPALPSVLHPSSGRFGRAESDGAGDGGAVARAAAVGGGGADRRGLDRPAGDALRASASPSTCRSCCSSPASFRCTG